MKISTELLAAYTEGNVNADERNAVRQFLAEHPEEIPSMMLMLDEDMDIIPDKEQIIDASALFAPIEEPVRGLRPELKKHPSKLNDNLDDFFFEMHL